MKLKKEANLVNNTKCRVWSQMYVFPSSERDVEQPGMLNVKMFSLQRPLGSDFFKWIQLDWKEIVWPWQGSLYVGRLGSLKCFNWIHQNSSFTSKRPEQPWTLKHIKCSTYCTCYRIKRTKEVGAPWPRHFNSPMVTGCREGISPVSLIVFLSLCHSSFNLLDGSSFLQLLIP